MAGDREGARSRSRRSRGLSRGNVRPRVLVGGQRDGRFLDAAFMELDRAVADCEVEGAVANEVLVSSPATPAVTQAAKNALPSPGCLNSISPTSIRGRRSTVRSGTHSGLLYARWIVRWRDNGRQRARRFVDEASAQHFEAGLRPLPAGRACPGSRRRASTREASTPTRRPPARAGGSCTAGPTAR